MQVFKKKGIFINNSEMQPFVNDCECAFLQGK